MTTATTTTTESEARNEADPPPPPPSLPTLTATKPDDAAASGDAVVITVRDEGREGNGKGPRADVAREGEQEAEEFEKVCRICHLSADRATDEGAELILIGCGCKNELGTAHRHCAETWFRLKGNSFLLKHLDLPWMERRQIHEYNLVVGNSSFFDMDQGVFASGAGNTKLTRTNESSNKCCEICGLNAKNITGDEDDSCMEEGHYNRPPSNSGHRTTSEGVSCWRGQPFCNFLMACLVVAFILPWFFRVNMF